MKIPILILSSVLMKIWQIPYVIFPNLKSVFLQILHDFSIMKYNSSVLFYIKRCILCTKGTSQSASFLDLLVLGSKFPKFLSFLKQKISFLQILCHSLVPWDLFPPYFFQLKLYVLSAKVAYQSTNLVKFHCGGLFCKNHIKFQLQKYRRLNSHDIEEWCKV